MVLTDKLTFSSIDLLDHHHTKFSVGIKYIQAPMIMIAIIVSATVV